MLVARAHDIGWVVDANADTGCGLLTTTCVHCPYPCAYYPCVLCLLHCPCVLCLLPLRAVLTALTTVLPLFTAPTPLPQGCPQSQLLQQNRQG